MMDCLRSWEETGNACGFAVGVERLLALMAESRVQPQEAPPDVYLVHSGVEADRMAWRVAQQLRAAGLSVVFHGGGGGFKGQMKKADASMARFAVIIGDDEVSAVQDAIGLILNVRSAAQMAL
jgi:histidyl-tRNA synthetase